MKQGRYLESAVYFKRQRLLTKSTYDDAEEMKTRQSRANESCCSTKRECGWQKRKETGIILRARKYIKNLLLLRRGRGMVSGKGI